MHDSKQHGDDWLIDDTEESAAQGGVDETTPWVVLIVDDEPDVHPMTRLALRGVRYRGRPLEILSAYSAAEGFEVLQRHPETALVLLDVVMETDDAGLGLARRIRDELGNSLIRIILRTGQPGQAPEEKVILEYDINDYKAKTELTSRKLFVTVIASLRTYESLMVIEQSRLGLRRILKATANLYQYSSLQEFSSGVLSQINAILGVGADGVLCARSVRRDGHPVSGDFRIVAGTGKYVDLPISGLPPDHPFTEMINRGFEDRRNFFEHPYDVLHFSTHSGYCFVVVVTPPWPLEDYQKDLLGIFCERMASAFENLSLYQQLQSANEATVMALADLAEFRDEGTGDHLVRVKRLSGAVAARLLEQGKFVGELTDELKSMIGIASILHDVGKVTTPDHILLKPGRLTDAERGIMMQHARNGEDILERAACVTISANYLSLGAQIAGGHHEWYDGNGYPRGLKGDEIPLAARIVAVVDVFDALVHKRLYKDAWELEAALDYLRNQSGKQFDPVVLEAFLSIVGADEKAWEDSGESEPI